MLRIASIASVVLVSVVLVAQAAAERASACIEVRTLAVAFVFPPGSEPYGQEVLRGRVTSPRPVRVWFQYRNSSRQRLRRTPIQVIAGGRNRLVRQRIEYRPSRGRSGFRIVARRGGTTVVGKLLEEAIKGPPPVQPPPP